MNTLKAILERREMLASLVAREMKSRYKGSVLGFLWTVLTPLFMAAIYVFFLRLLARSVRIEEIIIGVFAWQFTVQSVNAGMGSIAGNTNLVKKTFFPRLIVPTATTLASLVNFLLSLIVQFILVGLVLWHRGTCMSGWTFALPLLIVYHTLFNLSIAMLVGAGHVYFRDTQHLVGVLLSAWFFMSPVMYPLSFVEVFAPNNPLLLKIYMMNPVALIVTGYRCMILPDSVFPWSGFAIVGFILPLLLLVAAYFVFQRAQRNFADML